MERYEEMGVAVIDNELDTEKFIDWGKYTIVLTEEHINAIKNGKCLYHSDGEYGHIIKYSKDKL